MLEAEFWRQNPNLFPSQPFPSTFPLPFSNIRILSLFLMAVSELPMTGKNTFIPFSQITEDPRGVSSELLAQSTTQEGAG